MTSFASATAAISAPEATIAHLRAELRRLLPAPTGDQSAERDNHVDKLLASQYLRAGHPDYGGWDCHLKPSHPHSTGRGEVCWNLAALARAWAAPASRHHHSPRVAERWTIGWDYMRRAVYPGCPMPGNWWTWQVGIPETLSETLLLAGDMLSRDHRAAVVAVLDFLVNQTPETHPGANGMWAAYQFLIQGALSGDPAWIARAIAYADRAGIPNHHQGFLPDGSYSFHGRGLNMGYGTLHLTTLARMACALQQTPWKLAEATLNSGVRLALDFAHWLVVGDSVDPYIRGRGISMDEAVHNAHGWLEAMLLLAATADIPRRDELTDAARWMLINQRIEPRSAIAQQLADDLVASTRHQPAPAPRRGVRWWPDGEYAILRHDDWCISIKLASEFNKAYFGINRTNLKGWHISDGHMIFRMHKDALRDHVMPTQDWERLTGITRSDGFKLPVETRGQSWYVAGATTPDGRAGCCGVRFLITNLDRTSLNAHKSWFLLDDAIIATGSQITCDGPGEVETIIRQRALNADEAARAHEHTEILETDILDCGECAYLLPDRPRVRLTVAPRTGNWADLRDDHPTPSRHTRWFWTASLLHGVQPRDASYTIIYLPRQSAAQALAWWQSQPIDQLECTADHHRLRDHRTGHLLTVQQWFGCRIEPVAVASPSP